MARAVEAAGDALDVGIRTFVVDCQQNRLTAVVEGDAWGETLLVDGTLAGQASAR
jgi:hypothetical protein